MAAEEDDILEDVSVITLSVAPKMRRDRLVPNATKHPVMRTIASSPVPRVLARRQWAPAHMAPRRVHVPLGTIIDLTNDSDDDDTEAGGNRVPRI